jgi:hypothetical protein
MRSCDDSSRCDRPSCSQRLHHRICAWFDPERLQSVHEILGEVDAELREQERNALVKSSDSGVAILHTADISTFHDSHVK